MLRRIVRLITFILLTISISANDITFRKEYLDIFINDSNCVLEGRYFLSNNTYANIRMPIHYPIAINDFQLYPDSISVIKYQQDNIQYNRNNRGLNFVLNIPADTTISIFIRYRQKTNKNKFEYIVESTKSWGEPLQYAKINIHLPRQFKLTNSSFTYKKVEETEDGLIYTIEKQKFYPDKNIIINWENR